MDVSLAELESALGSLKTGKAGGSDGVAPDVLRHLTAEVLQRVLQIYNRSWTSGWCLQACISATIIPFLKKGKDPQAVSSYSPIALTSTQEN